MMLSTRIILIALLMIFPLRAQALCTGSSPTWTTTPDYESVNTCVQSATAGDTITVTAGDGTETWSSVLNIPRNIKLNGPGRGSLVITLDNGSNYSITTAVLTAGEISGFEFFTAAAAPAISIRGTGWRIYNNRYRNTQESDNNGVFVLANGTNTSIRPEGLIDNNIIINGKIIVFGGGNFVNESAHWASASSLGLGNSVYVEDNNFSMTWNGASNCMDSNLAGRYVFRYNTVVQAYAMAHSLQGEGIRGTREWEIYGNTFNSFGNASYAAMYMRGGTGVIFFNDTTSSVDYNTSILFDNVRSTTSVDVGGLCNGESIWDENAAGKSGWLCRDQIGAGRDASVWADNTQAGPEQEKKPVYVFGIYKAGVSQSVAVSVESQTWIQPNRDYYDYNASFNGTTERGVYCGASLPAACTTGDGAWITDQSCSDMTGLVGAVNAEGDRPDTTYKISGTLFKCTSTNTWEAYYTPYTYPHPLRDDGAAPDTTPPVISSPLPSGAQSCTSNPRNVTIGVTTNEAATCKYGTTDTAYASLPNTFSTTGSTTHSQSVSNACGSSYTYYVRCQDGSGNPTLTSTAISYSVATAGTTLYLPWRVATP